MRVWIAIILIVGLVLVGLTWLRTPEQRAVQGRRIVSLSPATTEILFELGLGDEIVGVSEHSDYPAEAKQIPTLGQYGEANVEPILKAAPDLVVGQMISPEKSKLLQQSVSPVCKVLLLKVDTLAEIIAATERIAQATGTEKKGKELTDAWQKTVAKMERLYGKLPQSQRVRVYVEVGANPLRTCGRGNYLSEMTELAGGKNMGDAVKGSLWPIVSSETVLSWNPQVILVMGMEKSSNYREQISSRLGWRDIEAVKTGRIYKLGDAFNRQGPRLFAEAEKLAEIIGGSDE